MNQIVEHLSDIGSEAGDILIDTVFDNDVIQKLPIVGWGFSLLKLGKTVSDTIFLDKLNIFINDINSEKIDNSWKEKFSDKDECLRISRKLIFIIDSITEEKKLKYLAKIFCDYVNGIISKDDFYLYCEIIRTVFISLLEKVTYFEINKDYTQFIVDADYQTTFSHLQANSFFVNSPGVLDIGIPSRLNSIGIYFQNIVKEINLK